MAIAPRETGAATMPRPFQDLVYVLEKPLVEHLHVHVVDAGGGQPDRVGRSRGEVELPATRVRATVRDLDDHGGTPVTHEQLRAEGQVRRGRRVLAVGLEDVPTRRVVTL